MSKCFKTFHKAASKNDQAKLIQQCVCVYFILFSSSRWTSLPIIFSWNRKEHFHSWRTKPTNKRAEGCSHGQTINLLPELRYSVFERQKVSATPPWEELLTALLLRASVKHSHMLSCCLKGEVTKTERRKILEKDRCTDVKGSYVSVHSRKKKSIRVLRSLKCFTNVLLMTFSCIYKSLCRLSSYITLQQFYRLYNSSSYP